MNFWKFKTKNCIQALTAIRITTNVKDFYRKIWIPTDLKFYGINFINTLISQSDKGSIHLTRKEHVKNIFFEICAIKMAHMVKGGIIPILFKEFDKKIINFLYMIYT